MTEYSRIKKHGEIKGLILTGAGILTTFPRLKGGQPAIIGRTKHQPRPGVTDSPNSDMSRRVSQTAPTLICRGQRHRGWNIVPCTPSPDNLGHRPLRDAQRFLLIFASSSCPLTMYRSVASRTPQYHLPAFFCRSV